MREHTEKRKLTVGVVFLGVVSLAWLIIKTGRKPSRIVYPCQKAAMMNVQTVLLLSASSINLGLLKSFPNSFRTRSAKTCLLLGIILLAVGIPFGSGAFTTSFSTPDTNIIPVELNLKSQMMESASSKLFFVQNASGVDGNIDNAVSMLVSLMQNNSLHFFKTSNQPDGLIAENDIILIKVNAVGPERAGTNTDLVKSLIKEILNHPEGFNGEIVIADNGQGTGGLDLANSNAYDHSQSFTDLVNMFSSSRVSTWSWYNIRSSIVNEYSTGDYVNGYIVSPAADPVTGIQVSYPKFRTEYGTYISFKNGIWNSTTQSYDSDRLKLINCPVLKSHYYFGVTGCIKMYQGVRYIANQAVTHDQLKLGALGTEMAETRFPTLNLLDAIWVNANPVEYGDMGLGDGFCGPPTPYDAASYTNIIGASLDPVAMDYWAAKNILIPTAETKGYTLVSSFDPDNASLASPRLIESFHNYLKRSMNELLDAGHQLTMDETQMNVYVTTASAHTNSSLSISLLPATTTPNLGTIISGSLTPNKSNANISIWYLNLVGPQSWNLLATIKTNSSSQYSYQWRPVNAGNYSVKASWKGDAETFSTETSPITLVCQKKPSTLTISLSRNVTEPQVGTTISGSLLPNKVSIAISIMYRTVGGSQSWNLLATVKTNSSSQYSYKWLPVNEGSYELKASWLGDSDTAPTETTELSRLDCGLIKVPSSLSISLSPAVTNSKLGTVITGSLEPDKPGLDISIWIRPSESSQWTLLKAVMTNGTGGYSYLWHPSQASNYTVKVSWSGDSNTYPAESEVIGLNCRYVSTSITLSTETSLTIGGKIVTTGQLTNQYGDALRNQPVTLSYRSSGATNWTYISSNGTDIAGKYSITWAPAVTGYFDLNAVWAGNATHSAADKIATISTMYHKNQYVFAVESNSSISQISFNETSAILRFHTSVPDETIGYAKVTIAKGLVTDVTKMKLFVDNIEKSFTLSSSAGSWLLSFSHSEGVHQIAISLSPVIQSENQQNGLPWYFFLVAFSVVSVTISLLVWKRRQ